MKKTSADRAKSKRKDKQVKKHAKVKASTTVTVPSSDWLQAQLMDFCQRRGAHPGDYADLFAIVSRARERHTQQALRQAELARRLRKAAKAVFDNGDESSDMCLVLCEDARGAAATLEGMIPLEQRAPKHYIVTGNFLPLSDNGVVETGLRVIPESTHEVLIVDPPKDRF